MNQATIAARQEVIAQFQADRAALVEQLDRLQGVILGHGFVVRCEGLTLSFTVDPVTKVATAPVTCPLTRAPRYTREDARTLAAAVANGNGTKGEAVHIKDALAQAIAELDSLIASLSN